MFRSALKLGLTSLGGAAAAIALLLGGNIWSYSRLTHETEIGIITFEQQGAVYQVSFFEPGGDAKQFVLQGDEWQLDARLIKWKSWANLLGKDTLYQLDRLSGRYRDAQRAQKETPSLVDLRETAMIDIWALARDFPGAFFMVDAQYGSSVFLPMKDDAAYRITVSNTGVLARPIDRPQATK